MVILLVNFGMKLSDIAQTLGVSVRTIQNWLPVAKLKYAKAKKGQPVLEGTPEAPSPEDESQNNTSPPQA